ncbi:MAG: hypothetical protein ABJA67_01270 [Chthonomonadales bacterium]
MENIDSVMNQVGWSVVMTSFSGDFDKLHSGYAQIFGRRGLDVFSLAYGRDTLPAELANRLTFSEATRITGQLMELGVTAETTESIYVGDLKYIADQVWATHSTDRFDFTEIDGLIIAASALNARQNLNVARKLPGYTNWRIERALSHNHADASLMEYLPRERIREELKLVDLYEKTLSEIYPDKRFAICHIMGRSVSFFQATEDAPHDDLPPTNMFEKVWCETCHRQQPYAKRTEPDSEFPKAIWGDCSICGNEMLIDSWEVLKIIGI